MTVAIAALGLLVLVQQVAHFLTQRANADERQKILDRTDTQLRAMADRVIAPEAASIAAVTAALPPRAAPAPFEGDLVLPDEDFQIADLLDRATGATP